MLLSVTLSTIHSSLAGLWTNQKFRVGWGGVEWVGGPQASLESALALLAEFEVESEPGPSLTITLLSC